MIAFENFHQKKLSITQNKYLEFSIAHITLFYINNKGLHYEHSIIRTFAGGVGKRA